MFVACILFRPLLVKETDVSNNTECRRSEGVEGGRTGNRRDGRKSDDGSEVTILNHVIEALLSPPSGRCPSHWTKGLWVLVEEPVESDLTGSLKVNVSINHFLLTVTDSA